VESFQGKTTGVTGWFEADPDSLAGPVSLEILVDLASFDTGIGKRNQHMRENHLETGQFPNAVLRGGRVKAVRREGKLTVLTLESELDLHGIQRPVAYELSLQWRPDGALTVDTEFAVKLSDHQIKRPRFLVMKLADEQKVLVHLTARPMEGDALAE
jgi:polyisoprenoid-binding protein YceI